jgi:hypothetical protein
LSVVAGFLSAIAALLVYLIVIRVSSGRSFNGARSASALAGLCLAALLTTVVYWPFTLLGILAVWFTLSLAVCGALLWFSV